MFFCVGGGIEDFLLDEFDVGFSQVESSLWKLDLGVMMKHDEPQVFSAKIWYLPGSWACASLLEVRIYPVTLREKLWSNVGYYLDTAYLKKIDMRRVKSYWKMFLEGQPASYWLWGKFILFWFMFFIVDQLPSFGLSCFQKQSPGFSTWNL